MPSVDPVDALLTQKRAARVALKRGLKNAKSGAERKRMAKWIKEGDAEIAALVSVQRQLIALRCIKAAARSV